MEEYGSPLKGKGWSELLVKNGRKFDIDPRMLAAFALAETSFGKNITRGENNIFNWLWNKEDVRNSAFESPASAVLSVAKGVSARGYNYKRATTWAQVYEIFCKGCTVGMENFLNSGTAQGADLTSKAFPCK